MLAVDRPGRRLVWGPLAGRFGWQPLDEWKQGLRAVLAADVTAELIRDLGLRWPSTVVLSSQVRVREALDAMPVLAIHEQLWSPLAAAGCHLIHVAYHRVDAGFVLETAGPRWPAVSFDGRLTDLWTACPHLGSGTLESIDRLVRAATCAEVDELAVRAADYVAKQVDDLLVDPEGPGRRKRDLADHGRVMGDLRRTMADEPETLAVIEAASQPDPPRVDHAVWEQRLDDAERDGRACRTAAEDLAGQLVGGSPPRRIRMTGGANFHVRKQTGCDIALPSGAGSAALHLQASWWAEQAP